MQAGRLDRRIRIEVAQRQPRTPSGEVVVVWVLQREVWAQVVENRGQESFGSNQFAAKAEVRFRIRYPSALDPMPSPSEDCRVVYAGKDYDILEVVEIGRREGMEIWAATRAEVAA